MGKGGQIWLKCITVYLIMMIRDKNNIFERVGNFHAEMAWNYPIFLCFCVSQPHSLKVFVHNTSPLLFFNIRAMSFMLQGTHEFLKGTTTDYDLYYIALTSK